MNPIALASGVLPEYGPVDLIEAAAAAGFDMAGLWVDPAEWDAARHRDTKSALAQTGMPVVDVEVVWLQPGCSVDDHLRILDIGMELGAANALCVSSVDDPGETSEWLARLCRHVEGSPLRVNLEFGIFTKVPDVLSAKRIVEQVGHPAAAILVDPIHVDRSGTDPADIAALDRRFISYAQFCDARAERPDPSNFDAIIEDAVDLREHEGAGAIDLDAIWRALPADIPLSIELRSKALRDAHPDDPIGRAKAVAMATRKWLGART